jgi:hypothetical protein
VHYLSSPAVVPVEVLQFFEWEDYIRSYTWSGLQTYFLLESRLYLTCALYLLLQTLEWKDYTWSGLQTEGMVGHLLTDVALLVIVTGYCLITGHDIVRSIQVR